MQCAYVHDGRNPLKPAGQQCGRHIKPGFRYCSFHGGGTAPAKAAAERALAVARMPAIEALLNIVEQFNEHTCPTCGYPNGEKETQTPVIRAAQVILDRTEMGPSRTLEVKQSDGDRLDLSLLTPEERGDMARIVAEMRDLKKRVKERIQPGVAGTAASPPDTPTQIM